MSRAKSNKSGQPRDVTPYWAERGFRKDLALSAPSANEDPKGEMAYQRAFIEAAKSNPPRLPNPSHYPNSTSAREYLRKREQAFSTPPNDKGQGGEAQEFQQSLRKVRDPDRSPVLPNSKSASASPASYHSQASAAGAQPAFSVRGQMNSYGSSPQPGSLPRLSAMEPPGAPMGPTKRLR